MFKSIYKSVWAGCLAFVLALSLVLTLRTQKTFSRAMYRQYEARMRDVIVHLEHEVDADDLRECIRTVSSSPERDELQEHINRMVDEFEMDFLYIIIPEKDGQSAILSVISSTSEAEREAGDSEDWPILYDATDLYTQEDLAGYTYAWQHPEQISYFHESSEHGPCYTAAKGLYTSDGELIALLCADYSMDMVLKTIRSYTIVDMITIVAMCTVSGVVLMLWLWQGISRPLLLLKDSVVDFAARNHGRRDLDELIIHIPEFHTRNEVQALAEAVREMADDMRVYVFNIVEAEHEAAEMRDQIEVADAANQAKSRFLAQMSHEIRTPINAVLGMNEMILNEAKEDQILDYAANIDFAGRQLLSIINTILDFSKIEDGKMEIVPADYDLAVVITNLVNGASLRAKMKTLSFSVVVDETLPSRLYGDDVRVTQVIQNILTNAIKYTEEGGVTFTVKNGGRDGDDVFLDVLVQDTGIGIREEDMEKLFASFERLDLKRNRRIEGTGLGMSIVTSLLSLMGSKLEVESTYGVGSTFSFRLRQRVVDEKPIGRYDEHLAAHASRKQKDLVLHAPEAKVLVVDDNAMNLKVAKNLLRMDGITPDLARSGAEAVEMIRENYYDIVFMDHMMPGMDGIETLACLRDEELIWPGMSVLALTANAVSGAREAYLAAGFADYLSKPFSSKELEEKLIRFLPGEKVTWRPKTQEEQKTPAASAPVQPKTPAPAEEILEFGPDPGTAPADGEVLEFGPDSGEALEFGPDGGDGAPSSSGGAGDALDRLAAMGLETGTGLQYCSDDADFYRELLGDFTAEFPEKEGELRACFEAEDWEGYRIRIHALKSIAKTIGAPKLSEQARSLEEASASGDAARVKAGHADCMALYRRLSDSIEEALRGEPS